MYLTCGDYESRYSHRVQRRSWPRGCLWVRNIRDQTQTPHQTSRRILAGTDTRDVLNPSLKVLYVSKRLFRDHLSMRTPVVVALVVQRQSIAGFCAVQNSVRPSHSALPEFTEVQIRQAIRPVSRTAEIPASSQKRPIVPYSATYVQLKPPLRRHRIWTRNPPTRPSF